MGEADDCLCLSQPGTGRSGFSAIKSRPGSAFRRNARAEASPTTTTTTTTSRFDIREANLDEEYRGSTGTNYFDDGLANESSTEAPFSSEDRRLDDTAPADIDGDDD